MTAKAVMSFPPLVSGVWSPGQTVCVPLRPSQRGFFFFFFLRWLLFILSREFKKKKKFLLVFLPFWISCCICSCNFSVFVGGGEPRIFSFCHIAPSNNITLNTSFQAPLYKKFNLRCIANFIWEHFCFDRE